MTNRKDVPTCYTGWKQVWDDCPVCGPDGPCQEPEEAERIRRNSTSMPFWRAFWITLGISFLIALTVFVGMELGR